jgi:hypothetical protein
MRFRGKAITSQRTHVKQHAELLLGWKFLIADGAQRNESLANSAFPKSRQVVGSAGCFDPSRGSGVQIPYSILTGISFTLLRGRLFFPL